MKYRKDKYGNELSQLGYGCMRFTKKGSQIDYEKAEREVLPQAESAPAPKQLKFTPEIRG